MEANLCWASSKRASESHVLGYHAQFTGLDNNASPAPLSTPPSSSTQNCQGRPDALILVLSICPPLDCRETPMRLPSLGVKTHICVIDLPSSVQYCIQTDPDGASRSDSDSRPCRPHYNMYRLSLCSRGPLKPLDRERETHCHLQHPSGRIIDHRSWVLLQA